MICIFSDWKDYLSILLSSVPFPKIPSGSLRSNVDYGCNSPPPCCSYLIKTKKCCGQRFPIIDIERNIGCRKKVAFCSDNKDKMSSMLFVDEETAQKYGVSSHYLNYPFIEWYYACYKMVIL